MTKNIDTLIPDIYNMLEQGVDTDNAEMGKFLDDFASQVREAASIILQEESVKVRRTYAYLKSVNQTVKWYGVKGVEDSLSVDKPELSF